MKFCIVSGNDSKIAELKILLAPEFEIEVLKEEYDEVQSTDACEVSKKAAKFLAEKLQKTVLVEDSGMYVDSLKGFPGTWTKFSHHSIGNEGILKLMNGVEDRTAWYGSAIGICSPGEEPQCFFDREEGSISLEIRGDKGWGQDPVFIPKGYDKTYGELGYPKGYHPFRKMAVDKLKRSFKSE